MSDLPPNPVTSEDVQGLRSDFRELTTKLEDVGRQVESKADTTRVDDIERLYWKANRNLIIGLSGAIIGLAALLIAGVVFFSARSHDRERIDENQALAEQNRSLIDEFAAQRTASRAATCQLFNDLLQTAIDTGTPPKTQAEHDAAAARTEAFRLAFEAKAQPLGCHFTFTVPEVTP